MKLTKGDIIVAACSMGVIVLAAAFVGGASGLIPEGSNIVLETSKLHLPLLGILAIIGQLMVGWLFPKPRPRRKQ